jgi:hypothetical protein
MQTLESQDTQALFNIGAVLQTTMRLETLKRQIPNPLWNPSVV